jgi:hypothetical protein
MGRHNRKQKLSSVASNKNTAPTFLQTRLHFISCVCVPELLCPNIAPKSFVRLDLVCCSCFSWPRPYSWPLTSILPFRASWPIFFVLLSFFHSSGTNLPVLLSPWLQGESADTLRSLKLYVGGRWLARSCPNREWGEASPGIAVHPRAQRKQRRRRA